MKLLHTITALLLAGMTYAQQPIHISVKNSTLAATDSLMPFWLTANRDGKVTPAGSWMNLTDVSIRQPYPSSGSAAKFSWGANAVAALGQRSYLQLNRAYGGVTWKSWELKGGMFYDPLHYDGLSTTNGNLVRSRNARPHPRVRLATRGYRPVPLLRERLWFRADFEEGLLNDNRFMDNARLHRKSLYLKVPVSPSWDLEGGLEHIVMWGGTAPVASIGRMPSGFKAYLQYITGASGDESFPGTDQMNVAGNQLGSYQFKATRRFAQWDATFYLSHLFEDLSGMNWRNWPDNLLGIHLRFRNQEKFISAAVLEYTHTRQQSIRGAWDRQEPDSYFNNSVYRSGFTYHQRVMGSPLFFPVTVRDGQSAGIASNMFTARHLGLKGAFAGHFRWTGMLTSVSHYGRYFSRFEPPRHQLSGLLDVSYENPRLPFESGISAAADAGNTVGRNFGLQLRIAKKW